MMKQIWRRICALTLALTILVTAALALTPQQAGELLERYYIDPVPEKVLIQPTVEEMLAELGDPYTEYMDASSYQAFLDSMRDTSLVGIGVSMNLTDRGAYVAEVIAGGPAQEAGIAAGDVITAVEGVSIAGLDLESIRALLVGEAGTKVTITVLRDTDSRDYTLERRRIVVAATTSSLLGGHIGYIDCDTFGGETLGHFLDGIADYDNAADHWIVDLRSNGGGDVDACVQSAGVFAGAGELAYLLSGSMSYSACRATDKAATIDPVVVLVNGQSASASEIFASVIRDRQAGIVVGSRTYGKGVAQIMLDESTDPGYFTEGDALKLTAYRFFSGGGATTDKVGVIPHLLVSDLYAPDVAYLLSASGPRGNTSGFLRLDMGWRWYIDLDLATSEAGRPILTALLEAVPPSAKLWLGTGGSSGWRQLTAPEAAAELGLTGYKSRSFTDVEGDGADAINTLATYGLLRGAGDGTFRPDKALTRGEFCVMLQQAMRYTTGRTESAFPDVPMSSWYGGAVNALYERGLITGGTDGLFHPEAPMDHQQFLTIMGRLAPSTSLWFYAAQHSDHAAALGDYWQWPAWAREWVWLLDGSQTNRFNQSLSVLWDDVNVIRPTAATTRYEAGITLYNLLSMTGILPA